MEVQLTKKKALSNFCKPYVIAELASNHNGDMKLAKKLITAAKEAGADCVKFQSWSKDTIFSRKKYEDNYFLADDYRDRNDYTLEEIVEKFSVSEKQLRDMKLFADKIGIDFTSTSFCRKEADFLVDKLKIPFIKVASMDVNNLPFLEYLAQKKLAIVLSTGLSELHEIDRAVKTIEDAGNKRIILLHCITKYPPRDDEINLNNIETLQKMYPYPVGFSDHSLGTTIPLAAVAKGACVIEKHLTLDKDMSGWDHKVSALPRELKDIVEGAGRIHAALGSYRIMAVEGKEIKDEFRRSIVAARNIKAGKVIGKSDIDYKRPGTGISPAESDYVIGRSLRRDVKYDQILTWDDFV